MLIQKNDLLKFLLETIVDEGVFVRTIKKEEGQYHYGIIDTFDEDSVDIEFFSKTDYLKNKKTNTYHSLKSLGTCSICLNEFFDDFLLVDSNFKEFSYSELLNLILSSDSLIAQN